MIGIIDSGWGGLSVLSPIRELLPQADLLYVADHAWFPYGERQLEEVQSRSHILTEYLIQQQVELVVIACHTSSAAALADLRFRHPRVGFVGIEPAVKPAASRTNSRLVGVLATPTTFQGQLFASVVERFAQGVGVVARACPGLADLVEQGLIEGAAVRQTVGKHLLPVLSHQVDTLVLGCTHYPFLSPVIREIAGKEIDIIDPGPAVARQVHRLAKNIRLEDSGSGSMRLETTGPIGDAVQVVRKLTGWEVEIHPASVDQAVVSPS